MLIYITWATDWMNVIDDHILGVYTDKETAIKKRNHHNDEKDYKPDIEDKILKDPDLLSEFSNIHNKDIAYVTKLKVPKTCEKIYFGRIEESGEGGSYHELVTLFADSNFDNIVDNVLDYYETEHNRDDECKKCDKGICKQNIIKKIKNNYFNKDDSVDLKSTDFLCSAKVWSKNIIQTIGI